MIDPQTREVKAMVGGYDYRAGGSTARAAHRQPGSAFKPFLYAAAVGPTVHARVGAQRLAGVVREVEAAELREESSWGRCACGPRWRVAQHGGVEVCPGRLPDQRVAVATRVGRDDRRSSSSRWAGAGLGRVVTPMELTNAYATFAGGRHRRRRSRSARRRRGAAQPPEPRRRSSPRWPT